MMVPADWPDREPVVALWVWQCVVAAVLLCCTLSMALSAAAAWTTVRGRVFAPAPDGVVEAYGLGGGGSWAVATTVALACGGLWTGAMLIREVVRARAAAPSTPRRTPPACPAVARRGARRRPTGAGRAAAGGFRPRFAGTR